MDGYTVVYSYNELFNNSAAGCIITAYDNFNISTMPEKPVLLTTTDQQSGKLGMRGLKSIDVRKAD
jgi:hypothetical protein